jgi:hypothetical protein
MLQCPASQIDRAAKLRKFPVHALLFMTRNKDPGDTCRLDIYDLLALMVPEYGLDPSFIGIQAVRPRPSCRVVLYGYLFYFLLRKIKNWQ